MDRWCGSGTGSHGGNEPFYSPNTVNSEMDRWNHSPEMRYRENHTSYNTNRRTVEIINDDDDDDGSQSSKSYLLGKIGHLKEKEAKLALDVINVLMGDSGDDCSRLAGGLGDMDGGLYKGGGWSREPSTSEEDLRSMLNTHRRTSLPEYPPGPAPFVQSSHMVQQPQRPSPFPIEPWSAGPVARPSAPYVASSFQHKQTQKTSSGPVLGRTGPHRVTMPLSTASKGTQPSSFDLRNRLKMKAINKPNLHFVSKAFIKVGQKKATLLRDPRRIEPIVNQAKKTGEVVTLKVQVGFERGVEKFTKGLWQWVGRKQWTKGPGAKIYACVLVGDDDDKEDDIELSSYPCLVCKKDYKDLTTFKSHQSNNHHRELSILYTMKLECMRGLLCAEEELTENQKLAAEKDRTKNEMKLKKSESKSEPKKPRFATEVINSDKWEQLTDDEIFCHFKLTSLRQLMNSFPMCHTCYKKFSSCEIQTTHNCTSTHLKNMVESEATDLEKFPEHFPAYELQELERTTSVTEILRDVLKNMKHSKKGEPVVIYDPGCTSVSEFQDITRDSKYKCLVCPKSQCLYTKVSEALHHFKSATHYYFYQEHLKGNTLEVREKNKLLNKKQVKAGAEGKVKQVKAGAEGKVKQVKAGAEGKVKQVKAGAEGKVKQVKAGAEGKVEQEPQEQNFPAHQATQELPAKKKVVQVEDDTEMELDEMEVVGDTLKLDDTEEEEEDMEVNQDQEDDSDEEGVEAEEEVEAEAEAEAEAEIETETEEVEAEVEAEEVEAEAEIETEEAEAEVEAEEVEAEAEVEAEVGEQETGEHEHEGKEQEKEEEVEYEQQEDEEEVHEQQEEHEEEKEEPPVEAAEPSSQTVKVEEQVAEQAEQVDDDDDDDDEAPPPPPPPKRLRRGRLDRAKWMHGRL